MSRLNKKTDDPQKAIEQDHNDFTAFYIGWLPNAPRNFARFIKRWLFILIPGIILLGILLALSQKPFGTGNFEFGQLTEVKGIYFSKPEACIKVISGKDIWGNLSYLTIPLVGYGKQGAETAIAEIEKENKMQLDHKEVVLKGTLLYNDGKTILQIDNNEDPVVKISTVPVPAELLQQKKELGVFKVKGEIIDPKCFFGVMKPGEGKPHRDCAIRCILGGITPMLAVRNDKGESNYYILVGPNGERMNAAVQDYVAEPVEIEARLVLCDDWIVAYVTDKNAIKRYSYLQERFGNAVQYCSANCMK